MLSVPNKKMSSNDDEGLAYFDALGNELEEPCKAISITCESSSYFKHMKTEESKEHAEKNGWPFIQANSKELFLDLDDENSFMRALLYLSYLKTEGFVQSWKVLKSKSGKQHIIAELTKELSETTRIAMQAILGSDRRKEYVSLLKVLKGQKDVVILFNERMGAFEDK